MVVLLLLVLLILFFTLCLRACRFRPAPTPAPTGEDIPVDTARAVSHLQAAIRCRTISEESLRDEREFEKFRSLLPECYPTLFSQGQVERIDRTGVLIKISGESSQAPAVFLGHYDVVPVQEDGWDKAPFDGVLEDGVLWGRGALDMKNQLISMLEAAELLLRQGFTPKNDIYFALSGEEEVMGPSARSIMERFREQGITPAFVLDEGGDIIDGFFPGTDVPCAMVGIGEKGAANLRFRVRGPGGHAATPPKDSPLPVLCRAMNRIEKHPFPRKPGRALEEMVDTMGPYCKFSTRLLLANRHFLWPLYLRWLRKQGGMIDAAARTTFALTGAKGSQAGNVIPAEAEMFANLRLMYGWTRESVVQHLQEIIRDSRVEIISEKGTDPAPDSELGEPFETLKTAIQATWPQAVVSPYLMVACTDSRHWHEICPHVYRFSAKYVTGAEKATVHGNNERIRIENTENAVKFFFRLMREC